MNITIVFPINNPFVTKKSKPVVSAAIPYIKYSKFKKDITIISPENTGEQESYKVINIKYKNKKDYYQKTLKELEKLNTNIIEVHQDIKLATLIAKKFPKKTITLIKHGPYLINRIQENIPLIKYYYQQRYLKYINYVFCISDYVRNTLQRLYPSMSNKFITCYNNYGYIMELIENYINHNSKNNININNPQNTILKQNKIIYTGKMQKAKGINEFLEAITKILIKYPNYQGVIVAGLFSKKNKYNKIYNNALKQEIFKKLIKEKRLLILKQLPVEDVFKEMLSAKIAIVPTKREEPFGLVALESHLAKCAVVSSGKGGLKEISQNHALYLNEVTGEEIFNKIENLIINEELQKKLATNGYNYAIKKFNPLTLVAKIDDFRENLE